MESILTSIKQMLGIEETYTQFDQEIIININSVFINLLQIGVGPVAGFSISDKTNTWQEFLSTSPNLEAVKLYMYYKVRLGFDPPATSFVLEAMKSQAQEIEWRLNVLVEGGAPSE